MLADSEPSNNAKEPNQSSEGVAMSSAEENKAGGVTEEEGTSSDAGESKDDSESTPAHLPLRAIEEQEVSTRLVASNSEAINGGPPSSDHGAGSRAISRPNLSTSSSSTVQSQRPRSETRALSFESSEEKNRRDTTTTTSNEHLMQGYAASASSSCTSQSDTGSLPNVITTSHGHSSTHRSLSKKGSGLRRGKWTVEEEAYVARVIQDFNSGFLDAPAGTTLRTYLSEKLQCDPMRITKKFTGDACIGKRVFHPAVRSLGNSGAIDAAQDELSALEKRWRRRLEMQQKESARKAAASAAAAAAVTGRSSASSHLPMGITLSSDPVPATGNALAHTASWLDKARTLLQEPSPDSSISRKSDDSHLPKSEIMSQIHQVEQLIHQGPTSMNDGRLDTQSDGTASPPSEPADKRLRRNTPDTPDGAEGAEALVDFLRSVRESAAAAKREF